MKIAMSLLSGISYGGVTYFNNLLPALAKVDSLNEYHIFSRHDGLLSKRIRQDNFFFHDCPPYVDSALTRLLWEQLILPHELKKRKIDIMFTAKNGDIFLAPCKTIISIRNMEPLCYMNYENHWLLNIFSWMRKQFTLVSIKKADRIIAASRAVKDHLERVLPGIGRKVEVIYNGNPIVEKLQNEVEENTATPFLLSASKFVAYANQLKLVEGYALLHEKRKDLPPLWFAGGIHDRIYYEKLMKVVIEGKLEGKIRILGLIPHWQLMGLYSRAFAFLFPSTLEACPQTLIEAMACGVPIAASNIPPMPEICKDAAIYFDPYNQEDIAEKIDLLLSDEHLRRDLIHSALERCRHFDWEKTAAELVKVFEAVYRGVVNHEGTQP